jgi:predicted acyltransferase
LLLTFVPAPGGVAGDLSPSGNLGAWIDRTVLGEAHLWRQSKTWDPEGLLSTLPAIASALTGIAAGLILTSAREASLKVRVLVVWGAALAAAGWIWGLTFPINKSLWTSSYVLFTSGLASMLLACCYWIVDVRQHHAFARPFVVMGVNALVLFVVSGWLVKTLLLVRVSERNGQSVTLYRWIHAHLFEPLAPPRIASLMFAVAALLALYTILEVMYRRRWFVRA